MAAFDEDLNALAAFAALGALATQVCSEAGPSRRAQITAGLRRAGGFLGLLQQDPVAWAHAGAREVEYIEALVKTGVQARSDRDWARADEARDELLELGVEEKDAEHESHLRMRA